MVLYQVLADVTVVIHLAYASFFFDIPEWLLSVAYVLFLCLILATFVAAPPRWPWR